jgi:hypothetical protein
MITAVQEMKVASLKRCPDTVTVFVPSPSPDPSIRAAGEVIVKVVGFSH